MGEEKYSSQGAKVCVISGIADENIEKDGLKVVDRTQLDKQISIDHKKLNKKEHEINANNMKRQEKSKEEKELDLEGDKQLEL